MRYRLEKKRTPNQSSRTSRGYAEKPKGITIHHWGADGQKHANVVHWLTTSSNNVSSAHDVVSAGLVTELADGTARTWHSGSNRGNGETIGIECRPEMSDGDWQTLVERCADHEERFGSLKYWKHSDWKATACPGRYSNLIGKLVDDINAEHARRKSGGSKPAPKPTPTPKPKPKGEAPGPGHAFPWPKNHYIGPKEWSDRSRSGFYDRTANGKTDREWIKEFVRQLDRRGWSVGKGKTYLTKYGNDGLYGTELEALIEAFQKEQGLSPVDGLGGRDTWNEAFFGDVT